MFRELLAHEFSAYAELSDEQLSALERHYQLLQQWNVRMNLTRIQSLGEAVQFHYCESLFVGTRLPAGAVRIADVGSGGGFPGIPIAVLRPDCSVTLIESHQRKSVFLREAARDLRNVALASVRADQVGEVYDWCVSRAVDPPEVLRLALAERVALLISRKDAEALGAESVEVVPWGQDRVLAKFHVKRTV